MIKYVVKGELENRNIEPEYFYNKNNPIEAREEAFNYFCNLVEILKDANENFVKSKDYINEEGNTISLLVCLGVKLYCILGGEKEHLIDFYGNFYEGWMSNDIAFGLENEFEYYQNNNFDSKEYRTTLEYCDSDFYEEDGMQTFSILKNTYNWKGKNEPYWWLTIDQKKDLLREWIEDLKISQALNYGESNIAEYKPSLVYNFKTKRAGIGIKLSIAKSICGFLNSNGGNLLIGVNDNKEIIGLDADFSLSEKDDAHDWFKLEFDNMIYQFFDQNVWNYIKADFNRDYDNDFFLVKISSSDNPVFLKNKKEESKEFYIRNTASTKQLIDIEEITSVIALEKIV